MKKLVMWVGLGLVVVLVGAGVVWGKQYYENRYVGADYYAQVPADQDMTMQPVKNRDGQTVGEGVKYNLTAYSADGAAKPVSFTVYEPGSSISRGEQPPAPGTYLKLSASKTTVLGWSVTDEGSIPPGARQAITG